MSKRKKNRKRTVSVKCSDCGYEREAQVSEMHCNFLINTGSATAHDLELLGETVRARVFETSGVRLEWEIKRIGEPLPGQAVEPFLGR